MNPNSPGSYCAILLMKLIRRVLQLLVVHLGLLEFTKDSGKVKRDKSVGLEQVEKLVEKVVGIVFNEIL
jgi:hypothetical protein